MNWLTPHWARDAPFGGDAVRDEHHDRERRDLLVVSGGGSPGNGPMRRQRRMKLTMMPVLAPRDAWMAGAGQ